MAELQELLKEAARAVKRGTAYHGAAPAIGKLTLVVAAPKAVRVEGGFLLAVGIDHDQARALMGELERFLGQGN